jgi:hypothetical protein
LATTTTTTTTEAPKFYYTGIICGGSIVGDFYSDTNLGDNPGIVYAFSATAGGTNQCFDNVTRTETPNTNPILNIFEDCNTCNGVTTTTTTVAPTTTTTTTIAPTTTTTTFSPDPCICTEVVITSAGGEVETFNCYGVNENYLYMSAGTYYVCAAEIGGLLQAFLGEGTTGTISPVGNCKTQTCPPPTTTTTTTTAAPTTTTTTAAATTTTTLAPTLFYISNSSLDIIITDVKVNGVSLTGVSGAGFPVYSGDNVNGTSTQFGAQNVDVYFSQTTTGQHIESYDSDLTYRCTNTGAPGSDIITFVGAAVGAGTFQIYALDGNC